MSRLLTATVEDFDAGMARIHEAAEKSHTKEECGEYLGFTEDNPLTARIRIAAMITSLQFVLRAPPTQALPAVFTDGFLTGYCVAQAEQARLVGQPIGVQAKEAPGG